MGLCNSMSEKMNRSERLDGRIKCVKVSRNVKYESKLRESEYD